MTALLHIWPLLVPVVLLIGAALVHELFFPEKSPPPIPARITELANNGGAAFFWTIFYTIVPTGILLGGFFAGYLLVELSGRFIASSGGAVLADIAIALVIGLLSITLSERVGRDGPFLERALRIKRRADRAVLVEIKSSLLKADKEARDAKGRGF
jgi:hypothetical protein